MRLAVISDGTLPGSQIVDIQTGRPLEGVQAFGFMADKHSPGEIRLHLITTISRIDAAALVDRDGNTPNFIPRFVRLFGANDESLKTTDLFIRDPQTGLMIDTVEALQFFVPGQIPGEDMPDSVDGLVGLTGPPTISLVLVGDRAEFQKQWEERNRTDPDALITHSSLMNVMTGESDDSIIQRLIDNQEIVLGDPALQEAQEWYSETNQILTRLRARYMNPEFPNNPALAERIMSIEAIMSESLQAAGKRLTALIEAAKPPHPIDDLLTEIDFEGLVNRTLIQRLNMPVVPRSVTEEEEEEDDPDTAALKAIADEQRKVRELEQEDPNRVIITADSDTTATTEYIAPTDTAPETGTQEPEEVSATQ